MIEFTCACGAKLYLRDDQAGKMTHCPECGEKLWAPKVDENLEDPGRAARRSARQDSRLGQHSPRPILSLKVFAALAIIPAMALTFFLFGGRSRVDLIVGHWRIVNGPEAGVVAEFEKGDRARFDGVDATYRFVEGTSKIQIFRRDGRVELYTIVSLSEDKMVLWDTQQVHCARLSSDAANALIAKAKG